MLNVILNGGWVMLPLMLCSVFALAIIIERSIKLRQKSIIPDGLVSSLLEDFKKRSLTNAKVQDVENSSELGSLLVTILKTFKTEREVVLSHIEDQGRKIIHNLEKHLNLLGTIATITPLLGLLGTVVGMIDVFTVITQQGVGNPNVLAGGISQALVTTAMGLSIAIPCYVFYRAFQRRIDNISYQLEHEAVYFLDIIKSLTKEKRRVRVPAAESTGHHVNQPVESTTEDI